eukprot:361840-Chlamydomonas_euryale.AAC.5
MIYICGTPPVLRYVNSRHRYHVVPLATERLGITLHDDKPPCLTITKNIYMRVARVFATKLSSILSGLLIR